jgi:hypothetical protein
MEGMMHNYRLRTGPPPVFATVVDSQADMRRARRMIESLRSFGGDARGSPVWVFAGRPASAGGLDALGDVEVVPLAVGEDCRGYPFAKKVFACALAEEKAQSFAGALAWSSPSCLFVNPPDLFDLDAAHDAAFRPVHIRNVGSAAGEPPDEFWDGIYRAAGGGKAAGRVESFVDGQILRPYFNTHCFSIRPACGILRTWRECFRRMVSDGDFQARCCGDDLHRIFLHQAVLSALASEQVEWGRIRILPPEYSYPLHLQDDVPANRRIGALQGMVCAAYEDALPEGNVDVREPLASWLAAH